MRKRLNMFNVFPRKIVIIYFLGLLAILLTSSFVIIVGLSQVTTFSYAATDNSIPGVSSSIGTGTILTEHNVKTVYTSQVPVTISDAINSLSSKNDTYPMTLTPVDLNQSTPLVMRGLPGSIIKSQGLASQAINGTQILLGSKAELRLHAKLGDNISVDSPFTTSTVSLKVTGFFTTGTEEDYEAIVPFVIGEQVAGLPTGIANALVLPAFAKFNQSTFALNYHFALNYTGPAGNLLVIDSSGYVHNSFQISGSSNLTTHGTMNLTIPYGLYELVLDRNGLRTTLDEFPTFGNNSIIKINSSLPSSSGAQGFLTVTTGGNRSSPSTKPILLDSSNATIFPQYFNSSSLSWVFEEVPFGPYSLILNNSRYNILLFGNSTFDAGNPSLNSSLDLNIASESGPLSQYSLTVKDSATSRIIFSSSSASSSIIIPVQSGHSYSIELLTSGSLLIEKNVSITGRTTSLTIDVPYVPLQLKYSPVSDYSNLGSGFPSAVASFDYFFGTLTTSIIALFSIIIVLLVLTLFLFDSQFLISLRNEIQAIAYLFPKRKSFFLKIDAPLLLLSLASAGCGIGLSLLIFQLFHMDSSFTFIGYGISALPLVYVSPVLIILSLLSWVKVTLYFKAKLSSTRV